MTAPPQDNSLAELRTSVRMIPGKIPAKVAQGLPCQTTWTDPGFWQFRIAKEPQER